MRLINAFFIFHIYACFNVRLIVRCGLCMDEMIFPLKMYWGAAYNQVRFIVRNLRYMEGTEREGQISHCFSFRSVPFEKKESLKKWNRSYFVPFLYHSSECRTKAISLYIYIKKNHFFLSMAAKH